jgi:hypothetical protein
VISKTYRLFTKNTIHFLSITAIEFMRKCLLLFGVLRDYFVIAMKLLMYFQNDLIDSISIESDKIVCPGYLSSFIRALREKHKCMLLDSYNESEFLLHGNFIKSPLLMT